jgi:hypothetical protein
VQGEEEEIKEECIPLRATPTTRSATLETHNLNACRQTQHAQVHSIPNSRRVDACCVRVAHGVAWAVERSRERREREEREKRERRERREREERERREREERHYSLYL